MVVKEIKTDNWNLSCYIPSASMDTDVIEPRPGILIFPGGGYMFCSNREAEPVALQYLAEGFNAFVLRYRVGRQYSFDDTLEDAKQGYKYIVDNGKELHTDPNKIAVCGFSAGGHLAAFLSVTAKKKPAATVLGYPCILSDISNILAFDVPSVTDYVTGDAPPAFITATFSDSTVPVKNSLAYAEALNKFNVPFELHIFPEGPHGFSVAKPQTAGSKSLYSLILSQWIGMSVDFLNNLFGIAVDDRKKF